MNCYVVGFTVLPYPDMQYMMAFAANDFTAIDRVRKYYRQLNIIINPQFVYEDNEQTTRRTGRPSRERRPSRHATGAQQARQP